MVDGIERHFHSPRDYQELARSPNASADDLRLLARSEFPFVRLAVAANPSTPVDALHVLLPQAVDEWNDQALLKTLAEHPSSDAELLDAVAERIPAALHLRDAHLVFAAGIALFRRHDTSTATLRRLLGHHQTTTQFRKVAARETVQQAVREALAQDRSETVRRAAARRPAKNG